MNVWLWLLIAAAPVLVFSMGPEKSRRLRLTRLALAVGLTYMLLNLSVGTERALAWENYQACQNQFHDGAIQAHANCAPVIEKLNDTNALLAYLLGWIPAAGYTGFWELLWRMRYRKTIKKRGNNYKGKWFSNIVILFFALCGLYVAYGLTLLVFSLVG